MNRRLPATRPPAPRVIHYVEAATNAELAYPMHPAQLAARQRQQRALYATWKARQEAIAVRDRKVRRFWAGFGAVIALGFLTGLAVLGWLIWNALTTVNLGALAVPVVLVVGLLGAAGGHKCITIVQHWH